LKRSGLTTLGSKIYNPSVQIISRKEASELAMFYVLAANKATGG